LPERQYALSEWDFSRKRDWRFCDSGTYWDFVRIRSPWDFMALLEESDVYKRKRLCAYSQLSLSSQHNTQNPDMAERLFYSSRAVEQSGSRNSQSAKVISASHMTGARQGTLLPSRALEALIY